VEVLRQPYTTIQEAIKGIANLESYYTQNYPDFLAQNTDLIQQAIKEIQDIYAQSVFPEQKSDWNSHPNNVGHQYFPGCFRCHDGKHINAQGEAIRLECNLCHSIPVVAGPNQLVTNIEIPRGPEPQTHKNPNWINLHHNAFDATCSNCHNTADAGGTSNTSFCSNSACHGTAFQFAGFDAPGLRELLQSQLPPTPTPSPTATPDVLTPTAPPNALTYNAVIGPLLTGRCGKCHGTSGIKGLNVTTYASLLNGGQDGPVIIPGDPQNSLLVKMQSGAQPHFGQLTPQELQTVIQWIQTGAPEQ
jgi:mono/diheme cytochrome c family protein